MTLLAFFIVVTDESEEIISELYSELVIEVKVLCESLIDEKPRASKASVKLVGLFIILLIY